MPAGRRGLAGIEVSLSPKPGALRGPTIHRTRQASGFGQRRIARRIASKMTAPTTATSRLYRLKPVTP